MQLETNDEANRLLRAVAEQLKLPLMHIARQAELEGTPEWQTIQTSADTALMLVDSYLFGLQFVENQVTLELEPVSVSSVLNDVAHQLTPLARQYNMKLELSVAGKYGPVMANRVAFQTALTSLGYALITSSLDEQAPKINLVARQNHHGVMAGMFGDFDISAKALRQARQLYGRSRQPLLKLSSSAAGIFVADTILESMASPLRSARYHKLTGLAATLQPSQQLQFV